MLTILPDEKIIRPIAGSIKDLRVYRISVVLSGARQGFQLAWIAPTALGYTHLMRMGSVLLLLATLLCPAAWAVDELTQYELLAPETHSFAIRYDTSATVPGATVYYNIIRPGSEARDENVVDRATGKELPFVLTDGKEAKAAGQAESDTPDETKFIKVTLPHPVPKVGEFRLRIWKTYRDPASYYSEGKTIVFERGLSVQRNMIVLPAGYELIRSSVPVIVGTESDGRIRVSMVNDRNDELAVKIVARKIEETR